MDTFNNYQVAQAVNDGLNSMNIPVTQQITNDVMNCIIPFIRNEISMASQSNQAVLALQGTINSLMMEKQSTGYADCQAQPNTSGNAKNVYC